MFHKSLVISYSFESWFKYLTYLTLNHFSFYHQFIEYQGNTFLQKSSCMHIDDPNFIIILIFEKKETMNKFRKNHQYSVKRKFAVGDRKLESIKISWWKTKKIHFLRQKFICRIVVRRKIPWNFTTNIRMFSTFKIPLFLSDCFTTSIFIFLHHFGTSA